MCQRILSEKGVSSLQRTYLAIQLKTSDGPETFATIDSFDGCSVLPEKQFLGTHLRVDTTRLLSLGSFLPPMGAAGERP